MGLDVQASNEAYYDLVATWFSHYFKDYMDKYQLARDMIDKGIYPPFEKPCYKELGAMDD